MNAHSIPIHSASAKAMEMYCEVHGQGEPLVLLHGFSGCGSNWEPFVGEFAREYQLGMVVQRILPASSRFGNPRWMCLRCSTASRSSASKR